MKTTVLCLSLLALSLGLATAGEAAISCTISIVSGVNFGNYDVFRAAADTTNGTILYNCKGVGSSTITIDLTPGLYGSFAQRRMRSGAPVDFLGYNLYLDANGQTIWGDGTSGTSRYGPLQPANNTDTQVQVYGRIPAGQDVSASSLYVDSVKATINF